MTKDMAHWLFKEEPTHYSFDDLLSDKRAAWNGVKNNLALKYLRSTHKGDRAFFYHTGTETAVVGVMRIDSDPYPDHKIKDPKMVVVDVVPERRLKRSVSLAELKADPSLSRFELIRIPRLSIMPVSEDIWRKILLMSER